jgi:NitT/TauT family transport system substrate-binding protein
MHWFSGERRGSMGVSVLVAAALALSACGGSGPSGGESAGGSGGGTTSLTVGYFPLVHTASVVNAAEHGLFKDKVELQQTAGGAQAIPGLVSGGYDITYANYTSVILAAQQGLHLQLIAGNDIGGNDHSVLVSGNSPIQTPADLAGKRIAVNNLLNIGTVAIDARLEDAGVDYKTVKYVELALPDMQPALQRGDVDAIWQVEPFQAGALAAGDRIVLPMFAGPTEGLPVAGWVTTTEFAKAHPDAISGFKQALTTSMGELKDNRDRLVELVPTYTKVSADVVQKVAMPTWSADLDTDRLQDVADYMERYELIDAKFDVSTITGG